jgi:cobalamin synthase
MDETSAHRWPRLADVTHALSALTILPFARPAPQQRVFARAALFFPFVGLLMGAALVAVQRLLAGHVPDAVAVVLVVLLWEAIGRFGALRTWVAEHPLQAGSHWSLCVGAVALLGLLGIKVASLRLVTLARPAALLFAPTLGRWAIVVIATGARDAQAPSRKFNADITFREFATTSVFTFAVLFALAEATGILVAVCAAGLSLAVRLLLHRWPGGVSWAWLSACCELVETAVVALFAALSR